MSFVSWDQVTQKVGRHTVQTQIWFTDEELYSKINDTPKWRPECINCEKNLRY